MFNWLKRWMSNPSAHEMKKEDMSRFVSEGGPDAEEARNSDKREALAIKAHKARKSSARKHVAKKPTHRKKAA